MSTMFPSDPSTLFALGAGCLILGLFLYNTVRYLYLCSWHNAIIKAYLYHLQYPFLLRRGRFAGPISRQEMLIQLLHAGSIIVANGIGISSLREAGTRAATLSVIHIVPLFFGSHLSFAADILGISLRSYRIIHRSIGFSAFLLGLFHVIVVISQGPRIVFNQSIVSGIVGGGSLLLLVLAIPWVKRLSYELFLRTHQGFALAGAAAIWRHLRVRHFASQIFLAIAAGFFGVIFFCEVIIGLFRNLSLRHLRSEVDIVRTEDQIKIVLLPPRIWTVRPGQYINIIIPGLGLSSFFQSHPLMIAWWKEDIPALYFLVEPRSGFTRRLLSIAHSPRTDELGRPTSLSDDYRLAFFSGPHGRSISMEGYGSVLLLATGIGIAAQLPYLKTLITNYNNGTACTRRAQVVWQLNDWREYSSEAERWINDILAEDIKDEGYILQMAIWVANGYPFDENPHKEGKHERLCYRKGTADVEKLFNNAMEQKRGRLLISISASTALRD